LPFGLAGIGAGAGGSFRRPPAACVRDASLPKLKTGGSCAVRAARFRHDAPRGVRACATCEPISSSCSPSGAEPVLYAGWEAIDEAERALGEPHGRPRIKLCTWDDLLTAARN
jgi:hypothetical protein